MLLESVHKRRLVVYVNFDQGFEVVSGSNIYSTFVFKCKVFHSFFWNGVDLANGWSVQFNNSVSGVSGMSIWWRSTFCGAVSRFRTVEAKIKFKATFPFFWGQSSVAAAASSSSSKTGVSLGGSINFGVFSGDFLDMRIISGTLEATGWSGESAPILIKFSSFLH